MTPERKAERTPPTAAQKAWKSGDMARPPVVPVEASRTWANGGAPTRHLGRKARPRATEFVRIELPPAVPPATVTPRPKPEPRPVFLGLVHPRGVDLSWQVDALCAQTDPEAFFPEKGGSTRAAKSVCASCPVQPECLAYALESGERFGIYGGMSERERRRMPKPEAPDPALGGSCSNGHPWTKASAGRYPGGGRRCRICANVAAQKVREKNRGVA